ncbi:dihydrolipoamide dehydrogenase [Leeuwenhoekiella nanhaiensis]|uniref:Dihydrolipoamide dehydrogenase n=1 Tax=Leeuwenhoekiella nanhaiensis TaxID=1655491 RepID=A0A2G1VQJ6_9FLAO|nr:dihydrolipoamide dehydrogenase [Leeuwenhoekiella nanhaiensis]PHQ28729.1 hypothetical protein CJ305_12985 [Leeuwenhoekiella nanhaiensis]
MKKLLSLLALFAVILTSCTGDPGPPGRDGFDGVDGLDAEYAKVIEVTTDFNYDGTNGIWFTNFIDFPSNVEFLDGDAVLAYRLEDVVDGLDVWTQLPHNFFLAEGTMQYVFTHTTGDIQFIIDGNFDLSNIATDYTDTQTFRYVLIPTEFAENFNGDFSNLNAVMNALELQESDVKKLN